MRSAFTIIEILISVVIISGSILLALTIHSDNHKHIVYLSDRNKLSLQDSLFLGHESIKYHKATRDADRVLDKFFNISEMDSKEILKNASRDFYIPEQIKILPPPLRGGFTAIVDEIKIKDRYSSHYFHFKLQ